MGGGLLLADQHQSPAPHSQLQHLVARDAVRARRPGRHSVALCRAAGGFPRGPITLPEPFKHAETVTPPRGTPTSTTLWNWHPRARPAKETGRGRRGTRRPVPGIARWLVAAVLAARYAGVGWRPRSRLAAGRVGRRRAEGPNPVLWMPRQPHGWSSTRLCMGWPASRLSQHPRAQPGRALRRSRRFRLAGRLRGIHWHYRRWQSGSPAEVGSDLRTGVSSRSSSSIWTARTATAVRKSDAPGRRPW